MYIQFRSGSSGPHNGPILGPFHSIEFMVASHYEHLDILYFLQGRERDGQRILWNEKYGGYSVGGGIYSKYFLASDPMAFPDFHSNFRRVGEVFGKDE